MAQPLMLPQSFHGYTEEPRCHDIVIDICRFDSGLLKRDALQFERRLRSLGHCTLIVLRQKEPDVSPLQCAETVDIAWDHRDRVEDLSAFANMLPDALSKALGLTNVDDLPLVVQEIYTGCAQR